MKTQTVNIAGVPTKVIQQKIALNKLILDQENPRIGLFKDSHTKPDLEQDEIEYAIVNKNPKAFEKLKESIRLNEGIINPIWVCAEGNKYVVIEGNTRVTIYKQLHEEYPNKEEYKNIPSQVLPPSVNDEKRDFIKLQAHLRGITPWDSYERARYLYLLNDKQGYSIKRLSASTKLTVSEIESAIKAFTDMEEQYLPKFAKDPSEVFKYSYFVEYEKDKKLQELMRKNNLDISSFCTWVGTGKIKRAPDVRGLREVIDNKTIRDIFIKSGYDAAIEELSILKPHLTSSLFENINKVTDGLNQLKSHEISEMREGEQPAKIKQIEELDTAVKTILDLVK